MNLRKQLLINNKKVYYSVIGKGAPVVLVHGFGEDGSIWNKVIENLRDQFQFVVPDLPGSGQSENINDMSIEGMAEIIYEVILLEVHSFAESDLHIDSAVDIAGAYPIDDRVYIKNSFQEGVIVIGHSMGGYITLAFAEKYGHKIKGFGLFQSTAYADSDEKRVTRNKGIEFIKQHGAAEFLRAIIPNLYYSKTKENNNYLIEEHLKNVSYFTESSLIAYYQSMINRPDRTNVLKNSKVPVLFMAGKHDTTVPLNDVIEQTHMADLTYIHILESSAHIGMVEQPELSSKILKEYLENTI